MEQVSTQAEKTAPASEGEPGRPEHSGAYVIRVCAGVNCYHRQAQAVYQAVRDWLKNDGRFSLETVPCLGVCGIPPAISVNGKIYGKMTPRSVVTLLGGGPSTPVRGEMAEAVPPLCEKLGGTLGCFEHVLRIPAGDPEDHIYDEYH